MKKIKLYTCLILILAGTFSYTSCTKEVENPDNEDPYKGTILPAISFKENGVLPVTGNVGDTVLLSGKGFAEHRENLSVLFNGREGVITDATDTTVSVVVPQKAATGSVTAQVGQQYFFGPFFRVVGPLKMDTLFPGFRGANAAIRDIIPVGSDQFFIVGSFTNYDNANIGGGVNRAALINKDGTIDRSFSYGYATGASSTIYCAVRIEEDAQYLVAGGFSRYGDVSNMNGLARLNFDGSLDSIAVDVPSGDVIWASALKGGVDGSVRQLHLLPDKKYIAVGNFRYYVEMNYNLTSVEGFDSTHLDSTLVNYIARFNPDGSLDTTYHYDLVNHRGNETVNGSINASHLLPDGKLLIAGNFTKYNGHTANRIARLNPDGSLDISFHYGAGADRAINDIEPTNDGGYLLVGTFNSFDGHVAAHAVKIKADGSYDPSFDIGTGPDGFIYKAGILSNGAVILSGTFRLFDGLRCNNFVVLNPDGSYHATYNSTGGLSLGLDAVSGGLNKILELPGENSILAVGNFTEFDYRTSNNIVKLTFE